MDKITLPDTTHYQFSYEATAGFSGDVTGRLASVTFPTGGSITYTYPTTNSGAHNGINCSDGSAPAVSGVASLTRAVSPGGSWKYTRTQVSGSHWQTKVTTPPDPQNSGSTSDDTVIDFQQYLLNSYETQRQVYQGSQTSGALLLTTLTCYNGNTSNCTTTAISAPISQTDVTMQYPSGGQQTLTETKYNSTYALPTDIYQYAYGSGAHGSLLRHTAITYASLGSVIVDHPASVIVDDGTNTLSKTTYAYDEAAYPVQTSPSTPQHQSVSGSRGNVTTITSYSSASASLSTHFQYYDTGMFYKTWDVNGSTTSYTYGTTVQGNSTISCGNSFPTSVTPPITGLSTSATWNCTGGVALTTTDPNGKVTTATYTDPYYWRPASSQDPLLSTTTFTYTAAASGNPATVEKLPCCSTVATPFLTMFLVSMHLAAFTCRRRKKGI